MIRLATLAATPGAPLLAQLLIGYSREDRWAQEVVPGIGEADVVWHATFARPKVLGDTFHACRHVEGRRASCFGLVAGY
jgi:hypothetical protein